MSAYALHTAELGSWRS